MTNSEKVFPVETEKGMRRADEHRPAVSVWLFEEEEEKMVSNRQDCKEEQQG